MFVRRLGTYLSGPEQKSIQRYTFLPILTRHISILSSTFLGPTEIYPQEGLHSAGGGGSDTPIRAFGCLCDGNTPREEFFLVSRAPGESSVDRRRLSSGRVRGAEAAMEKCHGKSSCLLSLW